MKSNIKHKTANKTINLISSLQTRIETIATMLDEMSTNFREYSLIDSTEVDIEFVYDFDCNVSKFVENSNNIVNNLEKMKGYIEK